MIVGIIILLKKYWMLEIPMELIHGLSLVLKYHVSRT